MDSEIQSNCGAHGDGAVRSMKCSAFDRVRLTDATVNAMLKHGRSLEETIVALVCEKNHFTQRIMELESIAPRKIALPDGRVMVWRCPDELVPEMPNAAMSDGSGK